MSAKKKDVKINVKLYHSEIRREEGGMNQVKMNWEQMFEAINALSLATLRMRKPGDWYVSASTEIKQGGMLVSAYGNGESPAEAVRDHWKQTAEASSVSSPLVVSAYGKNRREFYWNGYRWVEV